MRLLRFLFTARMTFVSFTLLSCLATLMYLAWYHRHRAPVLLHNPIDSVERRPLK